MPALGIVYLAVLSLTTLVYLRFTTPKILRLANNKLLHATPEPLRRPSWKSIWHEATSSLHQFVVMAFPIFSVICFAAELLDWAGILAGLTQLLAPVMALFNLPVNTATAIVLGSIRKDGIAIGLLDSSGSSLKVALNTPAQVLTVVYLSGVLLPCLVTVLTIVREMRWKFAAKICARQIAWAAAFSLLIAWSGALIF